MINNLKYMVVIKYVFTWVKVYHVNLNYYLGISPFWNLNTLINNSNINKHEHYNSSENVYNKISIPYIIIIIM